MKKQILLISCFVILISSLCAQPVNTTIGDVVMPAPTAASLGEYSDVPVNYYSGLPSISIPIYTVREGNLSLPISLSYHAGGIRAAEMASWVGLGWSLNAGGVITRTTLGMRDEDGAGGYYNMGASLTTNDLDVNQVADGSRDGEPDIFSFNVGGYTGKFIFDANKNPFLIPKQDIKIVPEVVGNQFRSFTITTPDGTKYLFGSDGTMNAIEKSKVTNINPPEPNFEASSWYLIKITSADGNYSIDLEYDDEDYSFKNIGSCSKIEYTCTTGSGVNGDERLSCQGTTDANLPAPYNHVPFIINNIEGKRLSKISCSTSVVEFTATNNREDIDQLGMNPARSLDKITIKPGETSTSFCTDWEFEYEYFTDGLNLSGSLSKRLKLTSVQQKACNNSDASNPNPYNFTYNSTNNTDGTQFLPNRLTKAIDHWGYYNGKVGNNNNVPFFDRINIPSTTVMTGDGVTHQHGQSDRETSEVPMKYGVLEQIQYPTGGTTTFDFEANEYNRNNIETIEQYPTCDGCTTYFPLENCATILDPLCCDMSNIPNASVTFESLQQIQNTFFTISVLEVAPDNMSTDCYPMGSPDVEVTVEVSKIVNGQSQPFTSYGYNLGQCQAIEGTPCDGEEKMLNVMSQATDFEPNVEYMFELKVKNGKGSFDLYEKVLVSDPVDVGGLRIAEINIKPDESSSDQEITKSYNYINSTGELSGVLYMEAVYGYTHVLIDNGVTSATSYVSNFQEQSVVPLSSFEGRHIGYKRVEEIHKDGETTNGKRIFNFHIDIDLPSDDPFTFPIKPTLARILDGNIKNTKTLNANEGEIAASANVVFNDQNIEATGIIYKAYKLEACIVNTQGPEQLNLILTTPYQPRTRPYRIKSSVQVIDGVATTTTYDYDGMGNHLFPTEISMTNSNESVYKIINKYVFDVDDPNDDDDVTSDLIDKNIISTPHVVEQYVGDNHVSGSKTEYAFFYDNGTTSGSIDPFPYPEKFYDYKANADGSQGDYELEGTITSYWGDGFAGKSGYPRGFQMDGWAFSETYDWENGLIKERKYGDFIWKYDYHPNTRLVSKITDIDDQPVFYNYDELMRLEKVLARPKTAFSDPDPTVDAQFNTVTKYTYNFEQEVESGMSEPENNYNYVRTRTDFTPVGGSELEFQESTQYMDGLGRPIQSVQRAYSAEGMNDVIVAQVYDNQGRVSKAYEPFEGANNNGYYIDVPTNHPHAVTEYEDSPLNRVTKVTPPAWNYPTLRSYGKNTSTDAVKDLATSSTATFDEGLLSKSVVEDPNGNKTITFTDKRGRLILSRRTNQNEDTDKRADTYYLYDDKDRLITVVPPGAETTHTNLIYEYTYDEENRVTAKKIPGAASMTMSYDDRDLVVAIQDGLLASQTTHKYLLTKYDDYGRVEETGFASAIPSDLNSFTITSANLLSKNYYDGASDDTDEEIDLDTHPIYRGKVRKTRTRLLDEFGPANHDANSNLVNWIDNLLVYDDFGRAVENKGNNHLKVGTAGGEETLLSKYDFADNVLVSNRTHQAHKSIQVYDQYRYDHKGRQKSIFNTITHQNITSPQEQICQLTYDYEDQITARSLGGVNNGTDFLQTLDYTYNEQGWLTKINDEIPVQTGTGMGSRGESNSSSDDLFYMEISYDQRLNFVGLGLPNLQRNGNISGIQFQTRGNAVQAYRFEYDYLDRLSTARYAEKQNESLSYTGTYDTDYTYDVRGNILTLKRDGVYWNGGSNWLSFPVDDLNYTYISGTNQISSVTDSEITKSGNVTSYLNLNLTSTYVIDKSYCAQNKITASPESMDGSKQIILEAGNEVILDDDVDFNAVGDGLLIARNAEDCLAKGVGFEHASSSYTYDTNGNLITDSGKGITVSYNHLNLPYKVDFGSGNTIEWIYDASGRKLRKTVKEGTVERYTQDYFGGIEYRGQEVEAIYHAEGRATLQLNNTFKYEYVLRDHLGNSRVIFADNNNDDVITEDEVLQESHYYPFGMTIDRLSETYSGEQNDYQYNGKELNNDFGLSWMDYGARFYDAQIGRWNGVDPLAESYSSYTPYNYTMNNPIRFIDPDGMSTADPGDFYYVYNGQIRHLGSDGIDDGKQYLVKDLSAFSKVRGNLNSETTSGLVTSGAASEIKVSIPNGQTEGEYFQEQFEKGDGNSLSQVTEQSTEIILDTENSELTVFTNPSNDNGPQLSVSVESHVATGGNPAKIHLGNAHTHQAAKYLEQGYSDAASQVSGDGNKAVKSGLPVYSFDENFVDKHVPQPRSVRGVTPHDNIAPTSDLYSGKFSILRDALRTFSGQKK